MLEPWQFSRYSDRATGWTASRTVLGPTQPPIQWIQGALSLGIKRPGREAYHSPTSSAEVKAWVELYLHSPSTPLWCGAQLKHRDNFTFTFISQTWLHPVGHSITLHAQLLFLRGEHQVSAHSRSCVIYIMIVTITATQSLSLSLHTVKPVFSPHQRAKASRHVV
jgi:hypothetical protein